jgi:hypothetical protein
VLDLLLAGVTVPVPAALDELSRGSGADAAIRDAAGERHRIVEADADLDGYAASGLPTRTMGRSLEEDRLFFAAALAAGAAI